MRFSRRWIVRHWTSDYELALQAAGAATAEQRSSTERALGLLLSDYLLRVPQVTEAIERVHRALFSIDGATAPAFNDAAVRDRARRERVMRDLEHAARSGRFTLVEAKRASVKVQRVRPEGVSSSVLGPGPEAEPTFFEARFVDEIGEPIAGLDVIVSADGRANQLTTDGSGKVRLDGVTASRASVRVSSLQALRDILEPRWSFARPGTMPLAEPMTRVALTSDVGSVLLDSELEHLIVIVPPLGKLFVELFDKTGRVRHDATEFRISGPKAFDGVTDANARLFIDEVPIGDYELTLAVDVNRRRGQETGADAPPLEPEIEEHTARLVALDRGTPNAQVRFVGVVPRVVMARLRGMVFDTNKCFLLPTALEALRNVREIYEANNPSQLLVVGHTDTTAEPAINDPLSVERAKSVKAYLEDDVDAWLSNYDLPAPKRWGSREDRLMITALPDFASREDGENLIEWFQRTRALEVDGIAGPKTREQLITEYMELDGVKLADEPRFHLDVQTHGAGENFPLAATGFDLDTSAANEQEDVHDRRVELFFFDREFGVRPPPGAPAGPEYLEWRRRALENTDFPIEGIGKKARVLEVADTLFRTNSCVVLPEGEAPGTEHAALTGIGVFAAALRFAQENRGKKLFIAGHTDTTSTVEFNQKLSAERARVALAVLEGDRDAFVELVTARHTVADYKQILSWCTRASAEVPFDCDPGRIDDNAATAVEPLKRFQRTYNANKAAIGAESQPDLVVDGAIGPKTWGAIFDVYELALREELGEDADAVRAVREELVFVDDERKALGFSEHHPVDQIGRDGVRSQSNRRVELLFFDTGEEPDLALAETDPDVSELYLPAEYDHETIPPREGGAKPHRLFRVHLLDATGAPVEGRVRFRVRQENVLIADDFSDDGIARFHVPPGSGQRVHVAWDRENGAIPLVRWVDLNCVGAADDPRTIVARLQNLGYRMQDETSEEFDRAVKAFQRDQRLPEDPVVAGVAPLAVRDRLAEIFENRFEASVEPEPAEPEEDPEPPPDIGQNAADFPEYEGLDPGALA